MMEMNRVTRMIHKARFSSRQRRAINYSHRYVITAADLAREENAPKHQMTVTETAYLINDLADGFDPENDDTDRRIFYEVTGTSLVEGEFAGEDTSDEERESMEAPDPLASVFNYNQVLDSEEEMDDKAIALISVGDEESKESKGSDGKPPTTIN